MWPLRHERAVVARERRRAVWDERRVAKPQAGRGGLKAPRRGDAIPPAGRDAMLDREYAGDQLGGSEVAVALARPGCLAQEAAPAGPSHGMRVDALLLDRYELVGDGVEVQLRHLEPTAGDRGLREPANGGGVCADVRARRQRAEVRTQV